MTVYEKIVEKLGPLEKSDWLKDTNKRLKNSENRVRGFTRKEN